MSLREQHTKIFSMTLFYDFNWSAEIVSGH